MKATVITEQQIDKLVDAKVRKLLEDFVVPKTGRHFTNLNIENQLNPQNVSEIVSSLSHKVLMTLHQMAEEAQLDSEEFIEYVLPEIVSELKGYTPKKEIGFH